LCVEGACGVGALVGLPVGNVGTVIGVPVTFVLCATTTVAQNVEIPSALPAAFTSDVYAVDVMLRPPCVKAVHRPKAAGPVASGPTGVGVEVGVPVGVAPLVGVAPSVGVDVLSAASVGDDVLCAATTTDAA
jgi:hypothetical protein